VIIANGLLKPPINLIKDDILIAADGGGKHCLALDLEPAYLVGDLDSLSPIDIRELKARGAQILQFPARKDFTDLELAVQHAISLEPDEIVIYGALGSRWDQTEANLLLAGAYPGIQIRILDGNQELNYIWPGNTYSIQGEPGDIVSLIPLQGPAEGITTQNLEYPLLDETLNFGSTRGVSNLILKSPGVVKFRQGLLLCIVIHQSDSTI
jgi:thiamine pyrophosphokinase